MIHSETHMVTAKHGPRPAGEPDRCFYCGMMIGFEHRSDCVMRDRTVVLKFSIELVVRVPENWNKDDIEFHRNESSWCASNIIRELGDGNACLCSSKIEYVREATERDEEQLWFERATEKIRVDNDGPTG